MQLANGNVPIVRSVLPDNALAATDATVDMMMKVAEGIYGMRSPRIRALSINIVRAAQVAEKDYYGEILAIHKWIQRNIRYMRDPVNQETLSHPEETAFNSKAADCDDMTILEIAMLGSIGIKAWPVIMGTSPGVPSHVYLRAMVPAGKHRMAGKIINLDPIMKQWAAGKEAPANRIKIQHDYRDGNYKNGVQRQSKGKAMSGLNGDLGDAFAMLPGMGNLGEYVTADSYLDDEHSHAQMLLKPDLSQTTGSVSNVPKVRVSMEGLDAMFGGGGMGDVEQVGVATPMEDRNDLRQLGPKGPLTALSARQSTQKIPSQGTQNIDAKIYEAPTLAAALRRGKGQGACAVVDSRRKTMVISDQASSVAKAPKTAREEAHEIKGLADVVSEISNSFLPGLGSMGEEDRQEVAERSALALWWAKLKARAASARAGWAEAKAQQYRAQGAQMAAAAKMQEAGQEKANAQSALQCAEQAGQITHAMARQDPSLAVVIAETEESLNQAGADASAVDGMLGLSADDLIKAGGNLNRAVNAGQGRRPVPMMVEKSAPVGMRERELIALRKNRQIVGNKLERMTGLARKKRAGVHRAMKKQYGPRFMSPVVPTGIRDPEQRGRTPVMRVTGGVPTTGSVPAPALSGPALAGFSFTSPLVLGAAGIGLWFLMKRKK